MTEAELKAALEAAQASIKALETKNAELLEEKRKAAAKAAETEDRLGKLEAKAKTEAEKAEAEAAKKAGDWDARETKLKGDHATEIGKLRADLDKERAARDRLVIDNAISAELDKAGVKPEFKEAARALLRTKKAEVTISDGGDFVGKLDGEGISDAVAGWAKSDAGKHFVGNGNSGGGGEGSGKGGLKGGKNPFKKDSWNLTEQNRLRKDNPTLATKMEAEAAA